MSNYNNHHLLHRSKLIGRGVTLNYMTMYASVIPFVVDCEEEEMGYEIHGEVYEVDSYTMSQLDRLEGHPEWYKRREERIILNDYDGVHMDAWIYMMPELDRQTNRLPDGDYRNYIQDYYYDNGSIF